MTPQDIADKVQKQFGDAVLEFDAEALDPVIKVNPEAWFDICEFLKTDADLEFDNLVCLSGFDYGAGKELGIIIHLYSFPKRHSIAVKADLPRENPRIRSIESLWRTADWHEREVFDLYGVVFDGHPDLRRILCPDDWEGYPLRKDYEVQEFYHGIRVPYKEDWEEFDTFLKNPRRGHFVFQFERTLPANGNAKPKEKPSP
ncbi:MAG: NADH-quinone oxidoreductase subunit C [candidate division KSB1 bacterium]|nr:NADH-quinone oxidoreductase subunit C [candidate division KSB1 bacterium]